MIDKISQKNCMHDKSQLISRKHKMAAMSSFEQHVTAQVKNK